MSTKRLREVARGSTVLAEDHNDVVAACRENRVVPGKGIKVDYRGPGGTMISADTGLSDSYILAKITASREEVAGSNRYEYSWVEVVKTKEAYITGAFTTKTNGRSGTYNLRNLYEYINKSTGVQGNGVAVENLVGTFKLKPAPNGLPVRVFTLNVGDVVEHWFEYTNNVDGACT